jgi:hypothetical protein
MSSGNFARSELRKTMEQTGAGLRVLLTNCCSNIAGFDPPNRRVPAAWDAFADLLFKHRGTVDITAAEEGTFGWGSGSHGGLFTNTLTRLWCEPKHLLDVNSDGFVTWNEYFARLRFDTNELFLKARDAAGDSSEPDHISQFSSQLPYAYMLAGQRTWQLHAQLAADRWSFSETFWKPISQARGPFSSAELLELDAKLNNALSLRQEALRHARNAVDAAIAEDAPPDAVTHVRNMEARIQESFRVDVANISQYKTWIKALLILKSRQRYGR